MNEGNILSELFTLIRGLQCDICAFKKAISRVRIGSPGDDQFMTRKEAAKYVRRSVSSLETARDLKFYKPGGGKVLYKKSDLDAWSESYSVAPVDLKAIDRMAMEDVIKLREKLKKAS
jgi:excisionase family DNA binding protein